VLLAAACPAEPGKACWTLVAARGLRAVPGRAGAGLRLAGLELQPAYADLARRNAARNGIAVEVHEGDLARMPAACAAISTMSSPTRPIIRRAARHRPSPGGPPRCRWTLPLSDWVRRRPAAGPRRLADADLRRRWPAEVLARWRTKLGSAAVLPLAAREGRPALRVILRARKGGRAAFRLLAPLVIHEGAGA
jgi:tRNA1Val (adenine37-N6)-methyltransferase